MGPIELERSVGRAIALTSCFPPYIPSHPPGLETEQGPPLSLPSRSIASRRNRSAGPHWSPKVVPFLTVNDMWSPIRN